ncbi:hypothetical protein IWQ61_009388 [Dispira simplex]|nr:hypothetical protein IWQ61_009388 [Dispira simplex]
MASTFQAQVVATTPYNDQKPGTSGLRKRVKVFQQEHYTENFVQSILRSVRYPDSVVPEGATLVVGGDGRYYLQDAIQIIIKIAAANKVGKLIIGQNGLLSTPAASNLIIRRKADGGILLTASHNPGGPTKDFGIKYNCRNGGPAPEAVTNRIYEDTKTLSEYYMAEVPDVDLTKLGTQTVGAMEVEIVDPVQDYAALMRELFDFERIQEFLRVYKDQFTVLFDAMHGVTGPYAHRIFTVELGLPESALMNFHPLSDFGEGHPDPNLTYAHELVERVRQESIQFGAAFDGDGDRNMIISHDWFVNPSDSVAVIANHAIRFPKFRQTGIRGVARSMPTSGALDLVGKALNIKHFEVPTGWKFFGNLLDNGDIDICGEESFGTGSGHIREKDGMWAALAWLNILADMSLNAHKLITVREVVAEHFHQFGRHYYSRYDYEDVDLDAAKKMMAHLEDLTTSQELVGTAVNGFHVAYMDNFSYTDPVDGSKTTNQGLRILFKDGARVVFRLSGTGSHGATVRVYLEQYESDRAKCFQDVPQVLQPLIQTALQLSKLTEYTGRSEPTVIT